MLARIPQAISRNARARRRRAALLRSRAILILSVLAGAFPATAARAEEPSDYSPQHVVVQYASGDSPLARAASTRGADAGSATESATATKLVHLSRGETVAAALRRLRRQRNVVWAVPDYRAHIAGALLPD